MRQAGAAGGGHAGREHLLAAPRQTGHVTASRGFARNRGRSPPRAEEPRLPTDFPPRTPVRWPFPGSTARTTRPGMRQAMLRGARGRCPCCGEAGLFASWLRPTEACARCDARLAQVKADDAPPYVVVFLVGHLVIATAVLLDTALVLSPWVEAAVLIPLTLGASLGLLQPVKGATIGLMLRLGMTGQDHA